MSASGLQAAFRYMSGDVANVPEGATRYR
jgi:hypothetical protein